MADAIPGASAPMSTADLANPTPTLTASGRSNIDAGAAALAPWPDIAWLKARQAANPSRLSMMEPLEAVHCVGLTAQSIAHHVHELRVALDEAIEHRDAVSYETARCLRLVLARIGVAADRLSVAAGHGATVGTSCEDWLLDSNPAAAALVRLSGGGS